VAGNIRQSRSRTTLRRTASSAPVFAALGDKTRLLLLERLARGGPLSITSLTEHTRVTRQAITKHLHVLASAGLARSSRHGREQLWELEGEALERARQQLGTIANQWDCALSRLKAHVERG
jgi:DNA-binding transcriptional ArsR family regulator